MELYYCDISEFDDLCGTHFLPSDRQERMGRYRQHDDRVRCLVAGLMLRVFLGVTQTSQLIRGPYNKPYLADCSRYFNLSHSGRYVVLATSAYEVGVDVEQIVPYSAHIAKKCFTVGEREWLRGQSDHDAFYALWTAKESIMKATGRGFLMSPESFSILPVTNGAHQIEDRTWFLQWHMLCEHILCVATVPLDEASLPQAVRRTDLLGENQ